MFDFINNRITIERTAYKLKGEPIATKPPKDNDVRTVKIDGYTIELIRQLKAEKESERLRLGTAWIGSEWLFTGIVKKCAVGEYPKSWIGRSQAAW